MECFVNLEILSHGDLDSVDLAHAKITLFNENRFCGKISISDRYYSLATISDRRSA